jgi:hypothetical protein
MADKKISALPAATTPLAGTEVLPIVQGGTTDQVSVADLTAGRAVNALSITIPNTEGATSFTGSGATIGRGTAFLAGQAELYTAGTRPLGIGTTGAGNLNLYTGSTRAFYVDTNQNFVVATAGKGIDFSANTHAAGMTSELLNDYEEGVWTGTLTGDAAAPTTPVTASGRYTRIGRQVTVQISLFNVNTTGASGVLLITGLPFSSSAERAYGSCFFIGMGSAVATAHIQSADNRISFLDAVTGAYINISAGAGKYVGASITYTV